MTLINQSLKEKQNFLISAAQKRLINFSELVFPGYKATWFHELIAEYLERALLSIEQGKRARIILAIPPRHGKSLLASNLFPAWALGKFPRLKIILSTYGADLAEKMGLATRDIISSEQYQAIFPGVSLRPDVKAKAKWMTNKNGSYTAVGIGGAITGEGGNLILIDDPHKDRAEAESHTTRETVWEYYRSTLYSRLEGYGAVVVIMQRWHVDDLVGRLKEEEEKKKESGEPYDEWEVINFPAIAEEDEVRDGMVVRKQGEALWPEKFPLPVLENIRSTQGVYNWSGQYMQDPVLATTQEFKEKMFRYYEGGDLKNKYLRYYTFIDPAISQKETADNTVVLTVAKEINGPNVYRIREDAGKFTPQQTIDLLFQHQAEYRSEVFLETVAYQMALKYSIIEEQRKRGRYFIVNELKTKTNKEVRIRGLLPMYEAGVIFHLRSDIDYERELLHFPRGKHDDRIDCQSFVTIALENSRGIAPMIFKPRWIGYGKKG